MRLSVGLGDSDQQGYRIVGIRIPHLIRDLYEDKLLNMNIIDIYGKYKECGGKVTTDTRTLRGGEMFFALRGENFDGNEYALKALEAGAKYAVVDREAAVASIEDERLIRVEDTLKALQELARWHRSMTIVDGKPLTVIALTGTNGKTTTKELIREVLSVKYKVTATEGNLNNNIGVPLTLLKITPETQLAVVEMGASHPGDIKELVDIALPNFGLITNVGKAHLLGFGSFEGVMNTKGELYDYLRRTSDKVFVNVDNPYLCRMASERGLHNDPERTDSLVIPYGLEYSGSHVLPSDNEHPYLRIGFAQSGGTVLNTNLVGSYNDDNVMAALSVGQYFGVALEDAVRAVEAYVPSNNRSQLTKTGRNTLIVDAYNANPSSMAVALDNLDSVVAGNKVALLGNMLELGEDSAALHNEVIAMALSLNLSLICLVGPEFEKCQEAYPATENLRYFATSSDLAAWLAINPLSGTAVLIKGSRGSRMENVISVL